MATPATTEAAQSAPSWGESLTVPTLCIAPVGTVRAANAALQRLWGGDPTGRPLTDLLHTAIEDQQPGLGVLTLADGRQRTVQVHPLAAGRPGERVWLLLDWPVAAGTAPLSLPANAAKEAWDPARARSAFFAAMAHQLRTPMNAIIGFSELLSSPDVRRISPEEVSEYGTHIHEAGSNLLRVLNDVLYLSRIDAGLMEIDLSRISLRPELDVLLRQVQHVVEDKDLAIAVDIDARAGIVTVDARYLRHMLQHLLHTAVRASPHGAEVLVRSRPVVGGGVMISLRDEGQGLSRAQLDQIMDPLNVGTFDYAQETVGGGLGLSIVKSLAEAHRGRFEIISRPGAGSSYHLVLPQGVVDEGSERIEAGTPLPLGVDLTRG